MLTELEGTFYTELPAFRWPKHGTNHEEDGQGRQGQARAAAAPPRHGQRHHRRGHVRSCCEQGVWRGAQCEGTVKALNRGGGGWEGTGYLWWVITLTFVRGGGEVVFKNTYESLSVDGRCVPITERTSLT